MFNFFGLPHLYYYVPKCPVCGSMVTGRYIKRYAGQFDDKIVLDGLNHGEIIKITPSRTSNNCFCLECNHEWSDIITPCLKNNEQIAVEKQNRRVNELMGLFEPQQEDPPKRGWSIL